MDFSIGVKEFRMLCLNYGLLSVAYMFLVLIFSPLSPNPQEYVQFIVFQFSQFGSYSLRDGREGGVGLSLFLYLL